MASREFDIIIFGATGCTGHYVMEELAHSAKDTNLKWAISGRNAEKLKESIDIVQNYLGEDIDIRKIPLITADVEDAASISYMCKRARVILNCVGPYNFFGETVVSACIENGTHHLDLSIEMKFLETTQAKYFKAALEKKVYILQSCGFSILPADYGISLLRKQFPGDLNSVEYFPVIGIGPLGMTLNAGTFLSIVSCYEEVLLRKNVDDLLERNVFKKSLVQSNFPLQRRLPPLFYSKEVKGWCLWFMVADERILNRSQKLGYEYLNERPVQSNGYLRLPNFFVFRGIMWFMAFCLLALFSWGRNLFAKYPSFFTAGLCSPEGPSRQQVLEGTTKFTFYAKGWKNKLPKPTDQHSSVPDTQMKLTISGPEAAYVLTAACIVQAGLTLLYEADKLPLQGGVLTPGVAFANTRLRDRLEARGFTFEFENE